MIHSAVTDAPIARIGSTIEQRRSAQGLRATEISWWNPCRQWVHCFPWTSHESSTFKSNHGRYVADLFSLVNLFTEVWVIHAYILDTRTMFTLFIHASPDLIRPSKCQGHPAASLLTSTLCYKHLALMCHWHSCISHTIPMENPNVLDSLPNLFQCFLDSSLWKKPSNILLF